MQALQRGMQVFKARAFSAWATALVLRDEKLAKLERGSRKWRHTALVRAWAGWRYYVEVRKAMADMARAAAMTWTCNARARAFKSWAQHVRARLALRAQVRRLTRGLEQYHVRLVLLII